MPFFGGGGGDYHIIVTNIKGGNDANPSGTGSNNMALGNGALQSLTTGDGNVAIGNNAGNAFTTENANTVLGYNAATLVTSFVGRATIIGAESLLGVTGHVDESIVMGRILNGSGVTGLNLSRSVLISPDTTAGNNLISIGGIVIGSTGDLDALFRGDFSDSVYVGFGNATQSNADYLQCVIVGHQNIAAMSTPTNSVCIGYGNTLDDNSIVIGANITVAANSIVIGDASHTSVVIGGVTLSSASGSIFPSAIIGDPGTEGTGINIGGVNYDALLKVSDISSADIAQSIIHRHSTTWEPIQVFARSNSNGAGHGAVVNSLAISSQYSAGWTGTEYNLFSRIHTEAAPTGAISDASSPGDIVFSTTPAGAIIPVEAARVKSNKSFTVQGNITAQNDKYVSYILAQWGVPSGIAPSGSIGNNGALTLGTALNTTFSNGIYLYFPANAISAGSAAGSYWCVMSSTTAGVIYNNTLNGFPTYVAAPTAFVTTGPGAYAGAITEITLATVTITGASMGATGVFRSRETFSANNNANAKTARVRFGGTVVVGNSLASTAGQNFENSIINRGVQTAQVVSGFGSDTSGVVGSMVYPSINTAANVSVTYTAQLSTATDWCILEYTNTFIERGA